MTEITVKSQFKELRISAEPNGRYRLIVDGKSMPRSFSWTELIAEVKRLEEMVTLTSDNEGGG